jgi:dihydropteroate synthase
MNSDSFNSWLNNSKKSPLLMGILNVTPDSFSDGGEFENTEIAVKHSFQMEKDGADIIDIGGESSRPGAKPITLNEELNRVIPIIERIRKKSDITISIDTYKSKVAEEAIKVGANIINDISGIRFDDKMVEIASKFDVPVIVMHMLGNPQNMQNNPEYEDVMKELTLFFKERINYLTENGIEKDKIIIDPGIGFGKTDGHNFIIIRELKQLLLLGCPILVGPSRKSFIGNTLNLPVKERLEGTAAAVTASMMNGGSILRVHDVKEMKRVIKITEKICGIS